MGEPYGGFSSLSSTAKDGPLSPGTVFSGADTLEVHWAGIAGDVLRGASGEDRRRP
jgi:hypothetical protein